MKIGSSFTKDKGTKRGLDIGGSTLMMGGGLGGGMSGNFSSAFDGSTSGGEGIGTMGDRLIGMPGAGGSSGMSDMTDLLKLVSNLMGGQQGGGNQAAQAPVAIPPPTDPGEPSFQVGGLPGQTERMSKLRKNMLGMQGPNDPFMRG